MLYNLVFIMFYNMCYILNYIACYITYHITCYITCYITSSTSGQVVVKFWSGSSQVLVTGVDVN